MYTAPAASNSGQVSWTSNHWLGALKGLCGSLQSTGAPVAVRMPPTTQLLLPSSDDPAGTGPRKPGVSSLQTIVSSDSSTEKNAAERSGGRRRATSPTTICSRRPVRVHQRCFHTTHESDG